MMAVGRRPFLQDLPFFSASAAFSASLACAVSCAANRDLAAGFQFLLMGIAGLVLTRLVQPADRDPFPLYLFLLGYSLAALLAILSPGTTGGDDESYFYRSMGFADGILHDWRPKDIGLVTYAGYVKATGYLQALNHWFGGYSLTGLKFFNACTGGLLGVVTFHLADAVFQDRGLARKCGLAFVLFPLQIYFSTVLFRDMALALAITYGAYLFCLQLRRRMARSPFAFRDLGQAGGMVLAAWAILQLRDLSLFLLVLGFGMAIIGLLRGSWRLAAMAVLVPGLAFVLFKVPIASHGGVNLLTVGAIKLLAYGEWTLDRAGTGSFGAVIMDMPMSYGWFPRIVYTLFFPVPPMVHAPPTDPLTLTGSLGAMVSYFYIPFCLLGCWLARGIAAARILFWPAFFFMLSIAMTTINVRHKTQFFAMYVILAVFAWTRLESSRWNILFYYCLFLGMAAYAYIFLKVAAA